MNHHVSFVAASAAVGYSCFSLHPVVGATMGVAASLVSKIALVVSAHHRDWNRRWVEEQQGQGKPYEMPRDPLPGKVTAYTSEILGGAFLGSTRILPRLGFSAVPLSVGVPLIATAQVISWLVNAILTHYNKWNFVYINMAIAGASALAAWSFQMGPPQGAAIMGLVMASFFSKAEQAGEDICALIKGRPVNPGQAGMNFVFGAFSAMHLTKTVYKIPRQHGLILAAASIGALLASRFVLSNRRIQETWHNQVVRRWYRLSRAVDFYLLPREAYLEAYAQ